MTPENTPQINNHIAYDEIDLWELFETLLKNWQTIAASFGLAVLAGVLFLVITPVKYEATAKVLVAQVAAKTVEEEAIALERLNYPPFYTDTVIDICGYSEVSQANEALSKDVKASIIKSTGQTQGSKKVINISLQGESPSQVRQCINAIIDLLQATHEGIAKSLVDSLNAKLKLLQNNLADASSIQNQLDARALDFQSTDSQFNQSLLMLITYLNKKTEIEELRQEIAIVESDLKWPSTSETSLLDKIYIPEKPVSPKKALTLVIAGLLGGVFGVLIVFIRIAFNNHKKALIRQTTT